VEVVEEQMQVVVLVLRGVLPVLEETVQQTQLQAHQ
jgi:hypothetical protein